MDKFCGDCNNLVIGHKKGKLYFVCCCDSFKIVKERGKPNRSFYKVDRKYKVQRELKIKDGKPLKCSECLDREKDIANV
jgi:hypothetical protein